jgi:hypothetical protein
MPFRNFDRRDSLAPSGHRLSAILEPFHAALFNRRQSFGAMLGVAGLAIIAGLVVLLVVRDLRPTSTGNGTGANGPAVDSDESIPSGPPPTSIAPILAEPPSTHLTSTARRNEETTTTESTTTSEEATTTTESTTTSEETTTTGSTTTSEETTTTESSTTRRPTTTKPPSTTIDPTTTEGGTTTSDPPPTGGNDPEGPTVPLIQSAAVTQVRATTARIGFTSPACVTASFSYAPVGQSATVIGGGSRCSRSHALLLGLVTPPLEPGTTYRVTIEATDADGLSTRRTLSFITLG